MLVWEKITEKSTYRLKVHLWKIGQEKKEK